MRTNAADLDALGGHADTEFGVFANAVLDHVGYVLERLRVLALLVVAQRDVVCQLRLESYRTSF